MNQTYTIKNFRVFDEQGATFEMAPVTILTGCNSAGKSTVTKSLMLLNDMFSRILNEYKAGMPCFLEDYALRLNSGNHQLGNFASFVNDKDKKSKKEFSIEYSGYTCFCNARVTVQITFAQDESTEDVNGRITRIIILDEHKNQICKMDFDSGEMTCDFALLKNPFFTFAHYASLYNRYRPLREKYDNNERLDNAEVKALLQLQDQIGEAYLRVFRYTIPTVYKRDHLNELTSLCELNDVAQYESLFFIDALKWLDGYKKVDVRRVVENHVKRSSLIGRLRYQEQASEIKDKIKLIIDEFYRSDFNTFKDFYVYYENLFLRNARMEFMRTENDSDYVNSFISKIEHSLAYGYAGVNSYFNFVKDGGVTYVNDIEMFWEKEEFRFIFILRYMRLITSVEEHEKMYNDDGYNTWFNTPIFDAMILYMCNVVEDVLVDTPSFICNMDYIDAQRAHAERYYNFRETSNFSSTLKEYLSTQKKMPKRKLFEVFNPAIHQTYAVTVKGTDAKGNPIFDKPIPMGIQTYSLESAEKDYSRRYVKGSFTRKWLQKFEIADDISFPPMADGAIVSVNLVKDGKSRNLADYGFGVTQLLELLLRIENNIEKCQREFGVERIEEKQLPETYTRDLIKKEIDAHTELAEKVAPYLDDTKNLPQDLLIELYAKAGEELSSKIRSKYVVNYIFDESYLALEEPETHLHPKYQSMLADMFYDAYTNYNIHFIIETHSEYLVRKTQVLVAQKAKEEGWNEQDLAEKCPFKVYYMPKPEDGKPYDMKYRTDGNFENDFGTGFYDVASDLAFLTF